MHIIFQNSSFSIPNISILGIIFSLYDYRNKNINRGQWIYNQCYQNKIFLRLVPWSHLYLVGWQPVNKKRTSQNTTFKRVISDPLSRIPVTGPWFINFFPYQWYGKIYETWAPVIPVVNTELANGLKEDLVVIIVNTQHCQVYVSVILITALLKRMSYTQRKCYEKNKKWKKEMTMHVYPWLYIRH